MKKRINIVTEEYSLNQLIGEKPIFDSCIATLAIAKIEYSENVKKWFESKVIYPTFLFFKNSYYRIYGLHKLLPNPALHGVSDSVLNIAIYNYDFLINFLSKKSFYESDLYEYYPVFMTFIPTNDKTIPPIGGGFESFNNNFYLKLFHHTTEEGEKGILKDKKLNSSKWNFCGTRKIPKTFAYFTDQKEINNIFDSLPVLFRKSEATDIVYRTDDLNHIIKSGVIIDDRKLNRKISFLIANDLIQPNPTIMHHSLKGQSKWLEIEFPRIYRIPCTSINLNNKVLIDGEDYWIIDKDNLENFRINDPTMIADGNNPDSLKRLIDDYYNR